MWTTISTWVVYDMLIFWRKYGEQVEEQFGKQKRKFALSIEQI